MKLRCILYKNEELFDDNKMPMELAELFVNAKEKNIRIMDCEEEMLLDKMTNTSILPKEVLVLAATDATIEEAKALSVAIVALKNKKFPQESLFKADALVEDISAIDVEYLQRIYQRKHGIPWNIAQTKRCIIREMTVTDVPAMCRLYEGDGMTDYMEPLCEVAEEIEKAKAYIQNMYGFYGYGMWLVFDKESGKLIGRAGLNLSVYKEETILELGYAIDVNWQGCGLATEVCEAVISYTIKEELGFEKLYCFIHPNNTASIRVAEKLGFTFQEKTMSKGKKLFVFSKKVIYK